MRNAHDVGTAINSLIHLLRDLRAIRSASSFPRMSIVETSSDTARAVGQRVQAEMKRQSIRQSAVALRLRLSQQAVSRRIRGEVAFDVDELDQVARLLDMEPADLLGRAA